MPNRSNRKSEVRGSAPRTSPAAATELRGQDHRCEACGKTFPSATRYDEHVAQEHRQS